MQLFRFQGHLQYSSSTINHPPFLCDLCHTCTVVGEIDPRFIRGLLPRAWDIEDHHFHYFLIELLS